MVTIKLKKPGTPPGDRPPVRGGGAGPKPARPTLAQAQAERAEREARWQAQRRPDPAPTGPANPAGGPKTRAFDPRRTPRPDAPPAGPRPAEAAQRTGARRPEGQRADPRRPEARRADAPRPDARRPDPQRPDGRRADPGRPDTRRFDSPPPPARPRRDPPPRPIPAPASRTRRPYDGHDDDDEAGEPRAHEPGSVRLSKRMSELGLASRREADEWIAKGYVRVDDRIVSELGSRVLPQQRITIDAKAKFQQAQRVTVLLNKPVGYVSGQAEDGYEPAWVLVSPQNQWPEDRSGTRFLREHLKSLVPAGRLDIDSVGLLVLTQDGRIAKQLIGEDGEVEKEYLVRVATATGQRLPDSALATLRHGIALDGEALRPAQVDWVNEDQLRFVLTQGKKRQIRRMCEAVGLQVLGLKRVRIGRVMLGDLPTGQWRYLRADETFV